MTMIPLQHSWAATEVEDDLRNLFIKIYTEQLGDKADEINVYGAPHIGPFPLIEREVAKDGLAVLRATEDDAIRFLFSAWRFRNPRRGMHFLKTYLQTLFGSAHEINQMWQTKDGVYPLNLKMDREVRGTDLEASHYLTSRVTVDIETNYLTSLLKSALATTVAARILLDVRNARYGMSHLGIGGVATGCAVLKAANIEYPPPYIQPPSPGPDDFGTVKRMMADLWSYIQRSTGASAASAGMPDLITTEGMVKNNQFPGRALGGYTSDGVTSSEGISLLMRGLARAYSADADPTKLAYVKFLMDAACKYYFFDTRPPANNTTPWYHTWMVNAGPRFNVRGPLAENGQLDQGGYIGVPILFVDGVARLTPAPDIVYQVVTDGTQFVWDNVFSDILDASGTRVGVSYYIDKDGNKVYGTQTGGSFGQPIQAESGEVPGKIVLNTALNGTYLVNYSVSVPDVFVEYGEVYEAWPMWRKLGTGERSMAADAMHWFVDAFRLLKEVDSDNPEWSLAHARMLDVWQECCRQESNTTSVFVAGASGPYNNFPLTYSFAYGVTNVDDSSTHWDTKPPTDYYTAERTSDGYVTFTLPADNSAFGSGESFRYGTVFENKPVYLSYDPSSLFFIDTKATEDIVLTVSITSEAGDSYHAAAMSTVGSGPVSLGIDQFMRFESAGVEVARWIPGEKIYDFNHGVSRSLSYRLTSSGKKLLVGTYTIPDSVSGFGITFDMVTPNMVLTVPPRVCYASTSDMSFTLKDGNGWLWVAPCPMQTTLAERTWVWSQFVLSSYQEPAKDGMTHPSAPVGVIQVFQFTGANGVHGVGGTTPQSISLAYISSVTPTSATSGDIRIVRLLDPSPNAHTWKIGDVTLINGVRRDIKYYGTLPFGLMIGGPSRARLAVIPYRGPYIAGYQSGTPWVDLADASKLEQMLDFMLESQHQFQLRNPYAILGPFMHSYLPATWDSEQYGTLDTWVWDGPDGNPAWNGWQYRAFDAMSHTWSRCVEQGIDSAVTAKVALICTRFLTWIHDWMQAHPTVHYIPSSWGPAGWSQGEPLPPNSYLDPQGYAVEGHDIALVMKGAIYCANSGADATTCKLVIARCIHALRLVQVRSEIDPMRGCFSLNPSAYESYAFHQGEIMDALALALANQDLLPDDAKTIVTPPDPNRPAHARMLTDGRVRTTEGGLVRVFEL